MGAPSSWVRAGTLARCRTALLRTSSAMGNTRAKISLHQCTRPGAERKLRRSSSAVSGRPASPDGPYRRKAAHLRIAKSVDGLHGVTDQEQRAPVAARPVLGERAQQFVLVSRGVLEFIDEDVHEPRAQAFGQGCRAAVFDQRTPRGAGDFGVIAFAVQIEDARQVRGRMQQQPGERVECATRLFGNLRVGQSGDGVERGQLRGVDENQQCQPVIAQRLAERIVGRDAFVFRQAPACGAFARERECRDATPARQITNRGRQRRRRVAPERDVRERCRIDVLCREPRDRGWPVR